MSSEEMTPAKWGMVGGAVLLLALAVFLFFRFTRPPQPVPIDQAVIDEAKALMQERDQKPTLAPDGELELTRDRDGEPAPTGTQVDGVEAIGRGPRGTPPKE